jgi:peptide deformylase
MRILTFGDETLRRKAEPVRCIGPEYRKIGGELLACLHEGSGVGLAGPQVGLSERIFAVHVEGDRPRVFINPSIIETSPETSKYEEGCLSFPGQFAVVVRPSAVRVQAWDERGRPFTIAAGGLLARVILHENDHLDGVLFIDRLPEVKRNRLVARYEKGIATPKKAAARA